MPESTSITGLKLIKSLEGFRSKAYQDGAGFYTIGYGHKINIYKESRLLKATLTEEQAAKLLLQDIAGFEHYLNKICSSYEIILSQNQYDALISFTYNTGLFSAPMLERLQAKDLTAVGKALILYCHGGGQELPGLLARRSKEQQLFFS